MTVSGIGFIDNLFELLDKESDSACAGYEVGDPVQKVGCTVLNILKGVHDGAESFSPIPDPKAIYEQLKYVIGDVVSKNIYYGYLKKVTPDEFTLTDCLDSVTNAAMIMGKRYVQVHFEEPAINLFRLATFKNVDFKKSSREIAKSFTESGLFYVTLFIGGRGKIKDTFRKMQIRNAINDPANPDPVRTVSEAYESALKGDNVCAKACQTAKIGTLTDQALKLGGYTSHHTAIRWLAYMRNEAAMDFLTKEFVKNPTLRAQLAFEATSPFTFARKNAVYVLRSILGKVSLKEVSDIIKEMIDNSQNPRLKADGHNARPVIAELYEAHMRMRPVLQKLLRQPQYADTVGNAIASIFD